ncbi:hypothetical protein LR004_01725, partial [Candidatus Gracilibacteria bacterium]|nr:hypothetical protein [Candidatus Gracilibacteria bacterium]
MKKTLIALLIITLSFLNVQAIDKTKLIKSMNGFYSKMDRKISLVEDRIIRLEKINNKIRIIKQTKWNRLNTESKELLTLIGANLESKIRFYEKELENRKENLSLDDILSEDEFTSRKEIDSLDLSQDSDNEKTYLTSTLKEGKKLDFGTFKITREEKNIKMVVEFKEYNSGYPAADLKNLYLEDTKGNKIYYNSKIASLGSTDQEFNGIIGGESYTLYGVVKKFY